ncbi:MAG: hypothetical protein JSS67_12815 [Bacteroidetes bacterium]|nr:hypothetical protein [Bacteroidota bacterium]
MLIKYKKPLSVQTTESIELLNENVTKFIKRILGFFSPFTFLFSILIVLFPYMLLHKKENIFNTWETWLIYPFLIINTIFIDLLFRKIFAHRKKLPLWVIESYLMLVLLHVLL